jgi:hypothetical protein
MAHSEKTTEWEQVRFGPGRATFETQCLAVQSSLDPYTSFSHTIHINKGGEMRVVTHAPIRRPMSQGGRWILWPLWHEPWVFSTSYGSGKPLLFKPVGSADCSRETSAR